MGKQKTKCIENLYDGMLMGSSLTIFSWKMCIDYHQAQWKQNEKQCNNNNEQREKPSWKLLSGGKFLHLFSNKSLAPLLWLWDLRHNAIMPVFSFTFLLLLGCARALYSFARSLARLYGLVWFGSCCSHKNISLPGTGWTSFAWKIVWLIFSQLMK